MQDELKPVAWRYDHPDHMTEYGTLRLTDGDKASGYTETPLYAHPPTTNRVAVSGTPVGDHQMVDAVAELQLAAFLAGRGSVTSMKHGTRTAKPCPTMDDFKGMAQAALTAARAQVEGRTSGCGRLWNTTPKTTIMKTSAANGMVALSPAKHSAQKDRDMSSELIERLREKNEWTNQKPYFHAHPKSLESADLIEAQAATIAQLQAELADAREVPGRIAEYLRDPHTVMDNMALWISKTKAGFMTSRTKGDLGIAAWFARNAATAIEARDWSKP